MKSNFLGRFAGLVLVGLAVTVLGPLFLSGPPKAQAFDSRATFPLAVWKADNGSIVGSIDQSGNLTVVGAVAGASIAGTTMSAVDVTNAAKTRIDLGPTARYAVQGTNGASFKLEVSNPDGTTNLLQFNGGIVVTNIAGYHR